MAVKTSVSVDRYGEWKSCCLHALGYDDFNFDDEEDIDIADDDQNQSQQQQASPSSSQVTFVNLVMMAGSSSNTTLSGPTGIGMSDSHKKKNRHGNDDDDDDHWMQALNEIDAGLHRMVIWMNEKKWPYVHAATPEQEASLIQSTISSYIATTANELESMRQMVLEQPQSQQQHKQHQQQQRQQHQAIMVQTLLEQLKEELAVPFGKLQKQRQRKAVQLWQNPLQCKLYIHHHDDHNNNNTRSTLDNDNENFEIGEQRFLPTKPHYALQQKILDSYYYNNNPTITPPPKRPASILDSRPSKRSLGQANTPSSSSSMPETENKQTQAAVRTSMLSAAAAAAARLNPRGAQTTKSGYHHLDDSTMREQEEEEFEHEAALLTAQLVDNQYDAVQKMESSMVDITTLLTQFSELVSSQQEDVWEIHQAATTAKENVQKGKENLVDAAESTKSSKHYMASAITSMGIVLLVFHWIRY